MILRTAGPGPACHPHPAARLSRAQAAAIVMSLVFHVMVGLYLYAYHFTVLALPAPPSEPPSLVIKTVTFPPPQPQPVTHERRRPPPPSKPQEAIKIHDVERTISLDPGQTIEAVGLGGGGAGNGGQGLGQVVATPPTPPMVVPKPKTILNPDWIAKPSGAQLADAYPDRALELGRAGSATLLCTVGVAGQVRDCTVAAETPRDFGFGAAALKLSRWFRIRPQTEDGQPVDGAQVRVPIQFGVG